MDKLTRYGYTISTDTSTFNDTFAGKKFSKIHVDTYLNKPYALFSRIRESNIRVAFENGRILLRGKDNTVLVDVPLDSIYEYAVKKTKECYQYVVPVMGVWYNVVVVL